MSTRFRLAVILLLVVIVLLPVGCSSETPSGSSAASSSGKGEPTVTPIPPPPEPVKPTYTVRKGEVVDSLSFTGRVSPMVEEELFFRESGRVKTVYVARNDDVTEGQLLAELDSEDLERQLNQAALDLQTTEMNLQKALDAQKYSVERAQINLEIKRLQLAKAEAQSNAPDVAIARASLQRADAARKLRQAEYDQKAGQGNVDLRPAALALEQATLDWEIAQARYDQTVAASSQAQIDLSVLRQQVRLAEIDLEQASGPADPSLTQAVERNKLIVERATAQLNNRRVICPINGKVTSVSAFDGRTVEAFSPVIVVSDDAALEITAEPQAAQMQRLQEGMALAVVLSAYPGKELPGTIIQLPAPYGGGGTTSLDQADKATHISFDAQDLDLKAGDLVKVIVTLEKKDNALYLPPAAIRTFAGRKFVVIEEEGRQRRVDVTTGIESAERVEILEGLEENLVVVGQ